MWLKETAGFSTLRRAQGRLSLRFGRNDKFQEETEKLVAEFQFVEQRLHF